MFARGSEISHFSITRLGTLLCLRVMTFHSPNVGLMNWTFQDVRMEFGLPFVFFFLFLLTLVKFSCIFITTTLHLTLVLECDKLVLDQNWFFFLICEVWLIKYSS